MPVFGSKVSVMNASTNGDLTDHCFESLVIMHCEDQTFDDGLIPIEGF
jgi:hypothetical protein